MIGLQLVTGFTLPSTGPLSLVEAKDHLRIEADFIADDAQVARKLKTAIALIEEMTARSLLPQTFRQALDRFPHSAEPIRLLRSPLRTVASVTYKDSAGDTQTIDSGDLYTETNGEPGIVAPAVSQTWPGDLLPRQGAVIVQFSAGYADGDTVPSALVDAVYLLLGHLYENRSAVTDWTPHDLPMAVESICSMWRVPEMDYAPAECDRSSDAAWPLAPWRL